MALAGQVTLTTDLGVDVVIPNAFVRVLDVTADKITALASVAVYKSADSTDLLRELKVPFKPDLDGCNFLAQAYTTVKALPRFAAMVDC